MQELNKEQIDVVSGGESLIDRIHRYEWNSYGVPLANGFIFAWNLMSSGEDVAYLEPIPDPED